MNRKININGKTLLIALLTLGMLVGGVGSAYAVTTLDATARFTAGVAGASELLDFDSGGSQIYDDWHLHIVTDDNLYLDAPGTTYVSGAMNLAGAFLIGNGNAAGASETVTFGSTGGSSIYDDWHMHIVTDDDLFLDAPGTTTVSGALTVTGDVTVNGGELYVTPVASSASTTEGTVYYDSTDDNLYVYANGAFVDLTAGATGAITLDTAYNTSNGAAAITVDAGSVTWALTDDSDFVVNINSAGSDFKLQDAGTDVWVWDSDATLNVTPIAIGSDIIDIVRHDSATGGSVFDIDMGTATVAGNALDISWGGAGTGDSIAINMDNNLEGAALAVTDSSGVRTDALIDLVSDSTAGDYIFIDIDGATAGHGMSFDVDGAMTGSLVNIEYATGAATGNVFDVTMGTNVSGGVLAVTSVNTSGTLIDLNVDPASASTVVGMNIDYGTAAVSGNMLDLNFSDLAHTGDAINIDMGDAAVGAQALVLNTADGVGTVNPIVLTYNNTSGQFALMDINYDGTRGGIMDIDLTGIFTDENVIDIDTTKAFTSNIIDITTSAVASAGNLVDLNIGNIADTGDALNVSMGAAAVDAQGLVMTTSAGIRTSSAIQITENNTTGAVATIDWDSAETRGGFMDIDFTGALATENLIDIDPTAAWTSSLIDITTGGGVATGDVMNVTLTNLDVAVQAFVVTNSAVTTTDGWLMDVDSSTAFTGNAYSFNTTGVFTAAANIWAFDSSNNSIWAGDIFNIDTGNGAATGDVFDINIEASAVNVKTLVVDNAAISASGNDGWLIDVDTTAAFAGDMISFTNGGTDIWTGSLFAVTTGGGAATGDVFNVTNTALDAATQTLVVSNAAVSTVDGWLLDIDSSAAWTGIMIDIDVASTPDDSVFDLTYSGAATGNAFDINMSANLAGNAFDIQAEGNRSAPLIFINGDNTDAGTDDHVFDIDQDGLLHSNILDITYGSTASNGNAVDVNMGTNIAGNALDIATLAGRTGGSAIEINDAGLNGSVTAPIIDVNVTGTTDAPVLDITFSGAAIAGGNAIDINMGTTAVLNDAINIASAATNGNGLVITNTNARADGSAISIVDSGNATANAATVEITASTLTDVDAVTITTALQTSGDALEVNGGASVFAAGSAVNIDGSGAYATNDDAGLLTITASGIALDGYIAAIHADAATTLDAISYVSGTAVTTGNIMEINGNALTTGFALEVDAGASTITTGAAVYIHGSGAYNDADDAQLLDITASGDADNGFIMGVWADTATDLEAVAYFSGNGLVTGNLMRLENTGTTRTTGHLLEIIDAADGAQTTTGSTVLINATGDLDVAALEITTAGVATTDIGAAIDVDGSGALVSGGSLVRIETDSNPAALAWGLEIDCDAANVEAIHVEKGLVLLAEGGTVGPLNYAADSGVAADAYVLDLTPDAPTIAAGMMFIMTGASAVSTGAATLVIDAQAADNIKVVPVAGGALADPAANDIDPEGTYIFVSDGTNMILINPSTTTGE